MADSAGSAVVLGAVGDVLIDRPDPSSALRYVLPILRFADITFGNFEGVLTDRHESMPGSAISTVVGTNQATGLAGFDVLSLANNHSLDAGYGGLRDSLDAINALGIRTVGAGRDLSEAWHPAVVTARDIRIAFVAVSSVLKMGWEARGTLGGIAALRATDVWKPRFNGIYSPGIAPKVVSVAEESDWQLLSAAIEKSKGQADFVVVSIHWGDHTQAWTITEFERETATRLAALGVNVILGHHHHYLRGIEFIGSTAVLYGLGHIAFDSPRLDAEMTAIGVDISDLSDDDRASRFGQYAVYPRIASPGFPFDELARWTAVFFISLGSGPRPLVSLVPGYIEDDGTPRPLRQGDQRYKSLLRVLGDCADKGPAPFAIEDKGRTIGDAVVLDVAPSGQTVTQRATEPDLNGAQRTRSASSHGHGEG